MNADEYFKRVQALRDERLALEVDEEQAFKQERYGDWKPDYCRKCGAETTRTDRLCDLHHQAAVDARRPSW